MVDRAQNLCVDWGVGGVGMAVTTLKRVPRHRIARRSCLCIGMQVLRGCY